jgi:hypothetical protein
VRLSKSALVRMLIGASSWNQGLQITAADKISGAVGGGVITFQTPQGQRVATATGLTEVLWPTEITTAKVSILRLK